MRRLALVALTLALLAVPSWSKPITVNGHYFEFATVTCPGASDCSLINQFTALPSGSQLILAQSSCVLTWTGTAKILQVFLAAKLVKANAPVRIHYLVPTLVATLTGAKSYSLNQQVLEPPQSGETPFILAAFNEKTTSQWHAAIADDLIP
jgi:hypothetical protein